MVVSHLEPVFVLSSFTDNDKKLKAYALLKKEVQAHLDKNSDISESDLTDFAQNLLKENGYVETVEVQIFRYTG